jgi:hypothetical protein
MRGERDRQQDVGPRTTQGHHKRTGHVRHGAETLGRVGESSVLDWKQARTRKQARAHGPQKSNIDELNAKSAELLEESVHGTLGFSPLNVSRLRVTAEGTTTHDAQYLGQYTDLILRGRH